MTTKPTVDSIVAETAEHIMIGRTHGKHWVEEQIKDAFSALLTSLVEEIDEIISHDDSVGYTFSTRDKIRALIKARLPVEEKDI